MEANLVGIDTNVLLRYVVHDEPASQYEVARRLIDGVLSPADKGYVTSIVLCEFVWVLGRGYRQPKETILAAIRAVLESEVLEVEHKGCAWRAWYDFDDGDADFSDYYIAEICRDVGATTTATFDDSASKHPLFTKAEVLTR